MVSVFVFAFFQQGDRVEYRLERGNSTIFELVPDSDEAVTASMTQNIKNCGFTPTFDRFVDGPADGPIVVCCGLPKEGSKMAGGTIKVFVVV